MNTDWLIIGLGNPGDEYERTRHNAGRLALRALAEHNDFDSWQASTGAKAQCTHGELGDSSVELVLPDTFMNRSGSAVASVAAKRQVKPERVVVAYDDIDLPFGTIRISFSRGAGGHKGVESIIRALKTRDFVRVRIGVCPTTPGGKLKKPQGEQDVHDFLLDDFAKKEREALPALFKTVGAALETLVRDGRERAMNEFN